MKDINIIAETKIDKHRVVVTQDTIRYDFTIFRVCVVRKLFWFWTYLSCIASYKAIGKNSFNIQKYNALAKLNQLHTHGKV